MNSPRNPDDVGFLSLRDPPALNGTGGPPARH
jgi:hypothetical protein